MSTIYISKSQFLKGLQCPKSIYLQKYHPELAGEVSESREALFESGKKVGVLARELHPGGVEAAKRLLHTPGFQYGFTELWQCGRLDITMEALVIQPQDAELFTEEEIQIAKTRLEECGYKVE